MPFQKQHAQLKTLNAECRTIHHRPTQTYRIACVHHEKVNRHSAQQANKIRAAASLQGKGSSQGKQKPHKIYDPKTLSPGLKVAQANGLQVYPKENMVQWGDKKIPTCDGSGFPYVENCFSDMSNWTAPNKQGQAKQCYLYNPGNTNLANGSIYTCGFLW